MDNATLIILALFVIYNFVILSNGLYKKFYLKQNISFYKDFPFMF